MAKYVNENDLPKKATVSSLKQTYSSKSDLNKKLKLLENFNRDSFSNRITATKDRVQVNKYTYQNFLLNADVAKANIQNMISESKALDKKEGRIVLASERTRNLYNNLKQINKGLSPSATYGEYQVAKRIANRYTENQKETNEQFYENFFSMFWSDAMKIDADEEIINKIENQLKQLKPYQLIELYNRESDIKNIVEDYHKYVESDGILLTDKEQARARVRLEILNDELPELIKKYKKL